MAEQQTQQQQPTTAAPEAAAAPAAPAARKERKPKPEKKEKKAAAPAAVVKKDTADLLGIEAKKADNFADWYTQVITRSEMLEYYDISGCYILRPWAYNMWENIQSYFDGEIKRSGVHNAYFPIFVSGRALNTEEDELEGFGAEVAWVTRSGKSELAEPIAVRPTSETVMYPAFKKWITSHRDLPLRVNQWCNVVRWEFKHPVPFIRTREFLWQEGHSAFATQAEADVEVMEILNLYGSVYEDILAVPVVRGKKSEKEKFAGALYTTTVEAFIPSNGRAVQAATSHCLGQTFAKMFGVEFENDKHVKQFAYQNSWGLTTRSIGVCVMVHGDDKGLVLPPRVAPVQVVVIPLRYKGSEEATRKRATELAAVVKACGVRVFVDDDDHTPGWKYNHWEVKGVPIRMELGPKDITNECCVLVRRDTGAKEVVPWTALAARIESLLAEIQRNLLERARADREAHTVRVTEWSQFVPALDGRNICLCTWCGQTPCEEDVKARSAKESLERAAAADVAADAEASLTGAAKTLCTPFEQPALPEGAKCFACGKPAVAWTLFGRSY
eukprot:m51a1_g7200 putative prolyl-trna synthetase (557) ;mRNA; f:196419-198600